MRGYQRVREKGITFLFKLEQMDPPSLHIFARHQTTIDDALDVFFETKHNWNERNKRFENYSSTHGIYWFWYDKEEKEVVIITCFRI